MQTTTVETISRAEEVIARCRKLATSAKIQEARGELFSPPPCMIATGDYSLDGYTLGAEVKIDAAGNLRGFYAGAESGAPRLLLGSHLDTVPNAGAFDGVLGVVLARCIAGGLEWTAASLRN